MSEEFYPKRCLLGVATTHDLAQELCQNHRNGPTNTKEEPVSFNTQKEIYEALIAGKKLKQRQWTDLNHYFQLLNGMLTDEKGQKIDIYFSEPENWVVWTPQPHAILKNVSFLDCWLTAKKHALPWDEFRIVSDKFPADNWWTMDARGETFLFGKRDEPVFLGGALVDKIGYSLIHNPKE